MRAAATAAAPRPAREASARKAVAGEVLLSAPEAAAADEAAGVDSAAASVEVEAAAVAGISQCPVQMLA